MPGAPRCGPRRRFCSVRKPLARSRGLVFHELARAAQHVGFQACFHCRRAPHGGAVVERSQSVENRTPARVTLASRGHVAPGVEELREIPTDLREVLHLLAGEVLPQPTCRADVSAVGRLSKLEHELGSADARQRLGEDAQVCAFVL